MVGAPTFVQPPVSQSVIKGQGLVLICLVQGDPEPEITWLFNGKPVTDGAYTTAFRFDYKHKYNVKQVWLRFNQWFCNQGFNYYNHNYSMYFVLKIFITRLIVSKWKISNDKVIKIRISLKYSLISISYFQSLIWGVMFL